MVKRSTKAFTFIDCSTWSRKNRCLRCC